MLKKNIINKKSSNSTLAIYLYISNFAKIFSNIKL